MAVNEQQQSPLGDAADYKNHPKIIPPDLLISGIKKEDLTVQILFNRSGRSARCHGYRTDSALQKTSLFRAETIDF